jgi:hypothetical protein
VLRRIITRLRPHRTPAIDTEFIIRGFARVAGEIERLDQQVSHILAVLDEMIEAAGLGDPS